MSNKPNADDNALLPIEKYATTPQKREIARRLGLERDTGQQYYQRSLKAYEEGDLENALLDVSEAIYYDRNHAELYAARGLYYIASEKQAEAEIDLKHALKLDKRLWVAHYGMGIVIFLRGQMAEALAAFDQVLRYTREKGEVWFYRAVTLYYLGDYPSALADIDRAIGLLPAADKRQRDAKTWRKEIEAKLPKAPVKAPTEARKANPKPKKSDK
jgi:tetratricopeptide (TPR) repeat protein